MPAPSGSCGPSTTPVSYPEWYTRKDRSGWAAAAGPTSTGEANGLPPDSPLCTAIDRHARVASGLEERRAHLPGGGIVVVEVPAAGRVGVDLPRRQLVGRRDLVHRGEGDIEGSDVRDGVALDQHAVVAAQFGGQRLAALHRIDRQRVGRADHGNGGDHGDGRVALGRGRGRASARPRSSRSDRPRRNRSGGSPCPTRRTPGSGSARRRPPPGSRRSSTTRWSAASGRRTMDGHGRLVGIGGGRRRDREPAARLGTTRPRLLVAARLQRDQPGRQAGRRQQEPPP